MQAQFSILLQKDLQNGFLLQNIQDAEQVEVAVICGIWNGLVDIVAGVPKMISMLASIGSSKGWDDIEKIYVTMSDYKNPETGNVGITGALSDGVSTMFDPGKPCELAHNTSGIVVGVAICFINPTAIEGLFGKVIASVVKIVQRLDGFADALNPLSRISNFVLKSAGTAMQATLKNGKLIIKVAMRADEVFREVDWSLAKTAQMIGPDGRTYTVLMSNDPMDAARTAGRKLKEILDDEKGIPLTDANGNGLGKVEVTDAEGKVTEEVAVVKLGSEISEETANILTRLKNKLKSNYKWTNEEILAFEGDFKGDLELLRKFDGDKGLVDSWKRMDDLGTDVIPDALRKDPNFLSKFDDVAKNNNLGLDADGIGDLLSSPKLKGQAWESPDAVLDAVKRGSDANIDGLNINHKKFPEPAEGNSSFVLDNAKQYQKEASGDAALSFDKGGRSFDNIDADGNLIDRKYGHGSSVFNADGTVKNQTRAQSILDQGDAQVRAANGTPVKWEVSTELGADGIQQLFDDAGIDIEVIHVIQQTIIN